MIILGGVKVLSEKTENDDNFQNDRLGPEIDYNKPDDFSCARTAGGNSGLILTAGRSGWWIETELQIRFRLK